MIRKKLVSDAIRDGNRFSKKIIPIKNLARQSIQFEAIAL